MTTQITDHQAAALARLAQQFKGKTLLEAFMGVFAGRYQSIEDALWQLYTERWLDTAVGVQLDVLGRILRQPRGNSADDEAYRLRLRARQRVNRSSGTVEQLLAVFRTLGIPVEQLWVEPQFPAGLTLHIEDLAIDEDTADLYAEFLRDARLGAVRALLHTSPALEANTFAFPPSTRLSANLTQTAGVYPTSVKVVSTARFAASGSVLLDYGASTQQRLSYTAKTATSLEGVVAEDGALGNFTSGALVVGVTEPANELDADFADPFPDSLPLVRTEGFPAEGYVAIGAGQPTASYRVFSYTAKTENTLEGVVALSIGTGSAFTRGALVVGTQRALGSNETRDMGGQLSHIQEA